MPLTWSEWHTRKNFSYTNVLLRRQKGNGDWTC